MGILNSFALWGGLAAAGIAVPIIIHLLHRKHRRQTPWAAMELLRRALVVRSGQVKMEDFLILFLRCLALLLIAAALLRPTMNAESTAWLGEKRVGMVIAIDASYSMGHGEHSRFEKAIASAQEILSTAREGDPVSILLMSNRPEILMRRIGYAEAKFTNVLAKRTEPTPFRLSLERNLEQVAELIGELDAPARECYLITDAQESDWSSPSESARDSLAALGREASVFVVPISVDGEENFSLRSLKYSSGSLSRSGTARFTAEVRNEGRRTGDGGTVDFSVSDELVTRQSVGTLQPGESRAVSFFASFDSSGDTSIKASLSRDDLSADNERFGVVTIYPEVRVLCVDGRLGSNGESQQTGGYYAVRALRLKGGENHPIRLQQIPAQDLALEKLADYDVILLCDVADLGTETIKDLESFVEKGGGLITFLGDQVDADLYNRRFADSKLLPAKLIGKVEVGNGTEENSEDVAAVEAWSLIAEKSDDSLSAIVSRLPPALVASVKISTAMQTEPVANGLVLLKIAESDHPLLISRRVGLGTSLLFTTSADRSWSNLPVHPLYTMLLQQSVTSLTSRSESKQLVVGEPVDFPVAGREVDETISVSGPEGSEKDLKVTRTGTQTVCALDADLPGIVTLSGKDGNTSVPDLSVAFNVDAVESSVLVVDANALSKKLEPDGIQVVVDKSALHAAIESGRNGRELSDLLLGLGIVAFLMQAFLAKRFTDRMSEGELDLSANLQLGRVAAARRS